MTLYDLLKRLKDHHKNLDYERSKTPWKTALGAVRERLPNPCRGWDIEHFEDIIRQIFAADFAYQYIAQHADPLLSDLPDETLMVQPVIKEFAASVFSGKIDAEISDYIKDELFIASKDGSAYRILADIYREFPEFVEKTFPLTVDTTCER